MIPTAPKYIQFFPSFRCNQDCTFCFNRDVSPTADMTGDEIPDFLRILSNAGIHELDILGGEPTLYASLFSIIEIARHRGVKVFLSTNGSNIDVLEQILNRDSAKGLINIGISLNDEEISGKLYNFILRHKPIMKGVVTTKRVLPEAVIPFLQNPDIRYNLLFMDTLTQSDLKTSLSFPEYYKILENLKKSFGNIEGVYCEGFIPSEHEKTFLDQIRCPAGTTKLSVMPDGSVYPCYLFFRSSDMRILGLAAYFMMILKKYGAVPFWIFSEGSMAIIVL